MRGFWTIMRSMLLLPETCPRSPGRARGVWGWLLVMTAFGVLSGSPAHAQVSSSASCTKWDECRTHALEAEVRGEFEAFHDYAWRTMQTRGKVDPEVMRLLARAQARSGRPHDALVMLRRITELGVAPVEALDHDVFARTRTLPGWPQVAENMTRVAGTPPTEQSQAAVTPVPSPPGALSSPPPPVPPSVSPPAHPGEDVLTFSARGMSPSGLAYDAASARVLVGDRRNRRIVTISERLKTSVDLVRAASAGFHDVLAIAIDERQGDLWVASATGAAHEGSAPEPPGAALHKLQLVSGRPLVTIPLDTGGEPARPVGIAVTRSGAVFVLDGAAGRVWRLAPREPIAALAATLGLTAPSGLAVDDDARTAYVAHREGLARVALGNGAVAPVTSAAGVDFNWLESLTWSRDGLLAVERTDDGARRVLRLRLSGRGTSVTGVDVLDADVRTCGGNSALAVSGKRLYYLTSDDERGSSAEGCTLVVRRLQLR